MRASKQKLVDGCITVLNSNERQGYTVPSQELYPHQWLWDSCFTSIGLRHFDIKRAKQELASLKRGAWANGMLPNIIFHDRFLNYDHTLWQSKSSSFAPRSFNTTGITQPPVLAEAVLRVGEKLNKEERFKWYRSMYDTLLNYHLWLYKDRDRDGSGLIVLVHPYESGLDNSPPWMYLLGKLKYPWWIHSANVHSIEVAVKHFRRDTAYVPISQRAGLKETLECFYVIRKLSKNNYEFPDDNKNMPLMQDLSFNCILIRANSCLREIASEIGKTLPVELTGSMKKTEASLETLWDEKHRQYFSRDYKTKNLIRRNTLATLLPLYAGTIPAHRASLLASKMDDDSTFKTKFPVPSVPVGSKSFNPGLYWQGPSWLNTNWMIAEGLRFYGLDEKAAAIERKSLEMIEKSGAYEYFSPLDGSPKGAKDFSWTAALAIDFAHRK